MKFDNPPSNSYSQFDYRSDIDGLRAIAILAVIVSHLNGDWLPGGFVGVDIFFVISGYVITCSILKSPNNDYLHYFSRFYIRRIKRLFPNLIVCVLVTSVLTALFIPVQNAKGMYATGVSALIGVSNLFFINSGGDYFATPQKLNPFTHTWSLGLEEQFYLFFPFIILLGYGLSSKVVISTKNKINLASKIALFSFLFSVFINFYFMDFLAAYIPVQILMAIPFIPIFLGTVVVASLFSPGKNSYLRVFYLVFFACASSMLLSAYLTSSKPATISYFFMPSRFWELASGASLFLGISVCRDSAKFKNITRHPLLPLFSVILILISLVYTPVTEFPFPWALVAVLGAILAIVSGYSKENLLYKLLTKPVLIGIGKISYSLYLWHWPIIVVFGWTVGLTSGWRYMSCVLIIFGVSILAYKFIETPFRFFENKAYVYVLFISPLVLIFLFKTNMVEQALKKSYVFEEIGDSLPKNHYREMKCHATSPFNFDDCFSPNRDNSRTLYLIGDSHAAAHLPMLKAFEEDSDIEVLQLTGGPILIYATQESKEFQSLLAHFETHLKRNDIIIAAVHRAYIYKDHGQKKEYQALLRGEQVDVHSQASELISSTERNMSLLTQIVEAKKAHIILVGDTPMLRSAAIGACLLQNRLHGKNICDVSRKVSEKHAEPLNNLYMKLSKKPYISFWNPHSLICKSAVCSFVENNKVLYVDDGHLAKQTSESLYPEFKEFLVRSQLIEVDNFKLSDLQSR